MKKKNIITILTIAIGIIGWFIASRIIEKKRWEGLDDGWDYEDWEDVEDEEISSEFDGEIR